MKYFSVCSGIEAATVGWHRMGWEPVAFSEIEPFPAAVLKHHYPNVPNLGDMTKIDGREYRGLVDVLVGGTPCQAFSVAGLRRGLVDPRGSLTLTFAQLADDMAVPFVVWENVPGVLSSKDNAFGCLLGLLAGEADALVPPGGKWTDAGFVLGPQRAVAWRVLDAQYFGLAQRRRRVFVVACPRGGADPREILFEREGVRRDTPPSREAGQGFAGDASCCSHWSGGPHPSLNQSNSIGGVGMSNQELFSQQGAYLVPGSICIKGAAIGRKPENGPQYGETLEELAYTLNCVDRHGVASFHPTQDPISSEDGTGRGQPIVCQEVADTITNCFHKHHGASGRLDFESETFAVSVSLRGRDGGGACEMGDDKACAQRASQGGGDKPHVLAFHQNQRAEVTMNDTAGALGQGGGKPGQGYPAIAFQSAQSGVRIGETHAMQVRRLVCVECEFLQGFPRNYTLIPWRGKPAEVCPDGPRYKALGNSMAVPCMRWIGERINKVVRK